MTAPKDSIKECLSRYREVKLSVTGRRCGKTISMPVWFALEGEKLYLLPVRGSDTQYTVTPRSYALRARCRVPF